MSNWIDVRDGLPVAPSSFELEQRYLTCDSCGWVEICTYNMGAHMVCASTGEDGEAFFSEGNGWIVDPSHWMPLPKAPIKNEDLK